MNKKARKCYFLAFFILPTLFAVKIFNILFIFFNFYFTFALRIDNQEVILSFSVENKSKIL